MLSDLTNLPRTIVPEAFFEKVMEVVADIPAPPEAAEDRALVRLEGLGGAAPLGQLEFCARAGAQLPPRHRRGQP